ncbi:MAG: molybdopterin-dependent oxidoreductase [Chloroflexi bacterium]|nr:molybdopterin-dependent oxidoreductase [Chloroflexota bacterium]
MATRIVTTSCSYDCGGRCVLKVHVEDGVVRRIETDDGDEPQLRACLRGRANRQRVYAPDRLLYPMKRVGERGEGKFQRVSWDEALDSVARELLRVKDTYGPAAMFFYNASGALTAFHGMRRPFTRLFNMFGGYTSRWGIASYEGLAFACRYTYGTMTTGNSRDDLLNSRLIILWGMNPPDALMRTGTAHWLTRAKEAGIRIICVDPRYSEAAATFAQEWLPVRPGADAAVLVAMAYVMIKEGLHDQRFLDKYTVGFERFRDYVLGVDDGQPRTPGWAEAISGMPAASIAALAREYATAKPAALLPAWSPGRTAYGEQFHRVAITLAAMTGNIGIPGGNAAGHEGLPYGALSRTMPVGQNPLGQGVERAWEGLNAYSKVDREGPAVHVAKGFEAVLEGTKAGYPSDVKLLYLIAGNPLNQALNTNKGVAALKKLETVIVQEQFMTPTARFADILLPVNTFLERSDVGTPFLTGPYFIFMNQAIPSQGESKSDWQIACELAPRLGIANYAEKSEEEWLRYLTANNPSLPDYDAFRSMPAFKMNAPSHVAFREQVQDPVKNPFPTPSGKIEIYSQRIADMNNPMLPPIPEYVEAWESPADPLSTKYPLQLISTHSKHRANSVFSNVPWVTELEPHALWVSFQDAVARGIKDGDSVRVFNDRGEMRAPAKVTERIMPGVVHIPAGAWYAPDKDGIDRGGCVNVLTRDEMSPGGAFPDNTCLVQVERV